MSFAELHQKELKNVNESVFGKKGVRDCLQELHEIVVFLGDEVHKLGTAQETPQLKEKIRENRLQANKLCSQIEKELDKLQHSKGSLSSSQIETTEEMERRKGLENIVSEFQNIKKIFSQLYFKMKPFDVVTPSQQETLLDSQLTLTQLKELQIDFNEQHEELLEELEALLSLFEQFRDIMNEQSSLLEDVETNTKGSLEELHIGNEEILKASKYGSFALPLLGGSLGALLGGPLGAAFGIKAGILLSGASLGIGAGVATGVGVGYYLKKRNNDLEDEWEWIKKK